MSELVATTDTSNEEQSPRSTVLLADSMSNGVLPGINSDGSLGSPDEKGDTPEKSIKDTSPRESSSPVEDPLSSLPNAAAKGKNRQQQQQPQRDSERATPTTPLPYEYSYANTNYGASSVTPQQSQRSAVYAYPTAYPLQTPEPVSPATIYDVGSFLQPPFHSFLGASPPNRMTPIPPPSPLVQRGTSHDGGPQQQPPVLPYSMSPQAYSQYNSPRPEAWNGTGAATAAGGGDRYVIVFFCFL